MAFFSIIIHASNYKYAGSSFLSDNEVEVVAFEMEMVGGSGNARMCK